MRILYAIQGTGNGHLSRARAIVPELLRQGVSLDLLVSGTQADIPLPYPVKFRFRGLSFIFGKQGGVDFWRTYLKANSMRLQREIRQLPVADYDLVLNDFEPVSAWACKLRGVPCWGVSHQAAVLSAAAPQPEKPDRIGRFVLSRYAPVSRQFGFHFKAYEPDMYTPVIRNGIRHATLSDSGHYTVYLPAYSDSRILRVLSEIPSVSWQVFSKHSHHAYRFGNVSIQPVSNQAFLESITSCRGVLSAAGFETPSEALFMGKKLCVIPMRAQLEQQCNAAALKAMGVPVLAGLSARELPRLQAWVMSDKRLRMDYPDQTRELVHRILATRTAPVWA
ncbi:MULTISPECIES: glycosyltransferase family protein [Robiginitalea]|uniref:Glycosyl transferase n=1 Tax=Robiginitalea biformata (strain ATCC BAA-864 / DSM 15991 / KCTC 12146 / HTCC2501) TaxID=313596 RepID=A4CJ78_ROBBH|nr:MULTISPECIES: glycosyltransferase family protein [Robiginitalea]EAR16986.1 hypothetical protein RB2501_08790 [Robiginitalea biformata HTCC2501]MDC6352811.1 glycosyltransferase family protein [Robiginitalea sp. PM2]MDC6374023.1 glycosyltransferase family protein [Robiginitalea sp. SP8]